MSCLAKKATFATTLLGASAVLAGAAAAQTLPRPIVLPSATATAGATFPPRPTAGTSTGTATISTATAPAATTPSAATPTVTANAAFPARPTPSAPAKASVTKSAATRASASKGAAPTPAGTIAANVYAAAGSTGYDAGADFNAPLPNEKTLHLAIGHSVFVDTRHRLARVYITNPDVLSSYTANPNQVVVTAKQAGASSLIVWDEVGDTQVYMISADTNVAGLSGAIRKAFPNEDIQVEGTDGRITVAGVVGTQATADAVAKLAGLYGKDIVNQIAVNSSRIKQVRLKVRFAEVDRSRISQFGFNLFAILNGNGANPTYISSTTGAFASTLSTGTATSAGTSTAVGAQTLSVSNPLNFVVYNATHNIGATIQDLEDKQVMHILAEPNITAMSGEKANFLAGGEFPFPVVQGGTAGSAAAVTIIFKPYGVKLDFTPIVNADGTIDLTVAPEVSALDYTNAVTVSGYTIPALSTRRASTRVTLGNGQSFAISGLLDQRTTDALGRTPGIASVPILGALFRSKNINHSNTELLVIVTPEVVDPMSEHEQIQTPASPVPTLDQQKFDNALPASIKKPSAAK